MNNYSNEWRKEILNYTSVFQNPEKKLREICLKSASERYGNKLPVILVDRLNTELSMIEKKELAPQFLIGAILAQKSLIDGYSVSTRGTISSSLVSYLMNISNVNPLPPHYYCPKCHHFETYEGHYRTMGYDLPDKTCPTCRTKMSASGANIDPELIGSQPDIILNVAKEERPRLIQYIKGTLGSNRFLRAGIKTVLEDGSIRRTVHPAGFYIISPETDINELTNIRAGISKDDFEMEVTEKHYGEIPLRMYSLYPLIDHSMIHFLEQFSGVPSDSIQTNDKAVLGIFRKEGFSFLPSVGYRRQSPIYQSVINEANPRCFSDLVAITAMLHGVTVWLGNGEFLIGKGKELRDLLCFRDDVMQKSMSIGLSRDHSFEIMERVRKREGLTGSTKQQLFSSGIPEWFIDSCNKAEYLFPKGAAVEIMLNYWKLAYYKIHFPELYKDVIE